MAQLALAVGGAAIGSFFGAPGIGWAIGSVVGGLLFAPRTHTQGPRLQDLTVTVSSYGVAVPTVWGTCRTAGNIIWAAPLEEVETVDSVGKGGSSTVTSYSYFATFAVAICDGPIAAVTRIWANGKLVYDTRATAEASMVAASDELAEVMQFFLGSESQDPSSVIEAVEGAGNVPGYRGLAYVVFDRLPLAAFGNVLPNLEFEVIADGAVEIPTLVRSYANLPAGVDPPLAARMEGSEVVVARYADSGHWRAVISADADAVVVEQMQQALLPPGGYGVRNFTPNQVRNDPDIIVVAIAVFVDGDEENGTQRTWFQYAGARAQATTGWSTLQKGSISALWQGDPGPFALLELGGGHYVYQTPVKVVANNTVLLARHRLAQYSLADYYDDPLQLLLPAGLTATGPYLGNDGVAADVQRNCIVIGGVTGTDLSRCFVVDGETMQVVAVYSAIPTLVAAGYGRAVVWAQVASEHYLRVYDISATGGTVASPLTPVLLNTDNSPLATPPYLGMPAPDSGLVFHGADLWRYSDAVTAAPPTLEQVVTRIAVAAGYAQADVVATSLAGITVQGYIRRERMTGAAMLQALAQVYGFDCAEVDGKLLARLRSATADATLAADDLLGDATEPAVATRRLQEAELPKELDLNYMSYGADYTVGSQSAARIVTESRQKLAFDAPVVMADDEAAARCRRMFWEAWIGRSTRTFRLGPQHSRLVPTDVVSLPLDDAGSTATARLVSVQRDGIVLACEAVDVDAAAFTQPDTAGAIPAYGGGSSVLPATQLALVDGTPPLRDGDDTYGFYAAASSYSASWPGAVVSLQPAGGAAAPVGTVSRRAMLGRAQTALADWAPGDARLDTAGSVTVAVESGAVPASITLAEQMESSANTFLVGDEIVRARTVATVSANVVTLSNLLRGLQGTPTGGHAAGERVVQLDTALLPVEFAQSWVGNSGLVRAETLGQRAGSGAAAGLVFSAARIHPLPVAQLRAMRLANGDILIRWLRRARTQNGYATGAGIWLDEPAEAYDLEILDPAGTAVARTASSLASGSYTYAAAHVLADQATANPTALWLRAYQIGSRAGRGRTELRSVPVELPNSPVSLLLHGDGSNGSTTFTDSSPYVHPVTLTGSGITISNGQSRFGGTSIYFNNVGQSGNYLSLADHPALRLGLDDFTIAFWVYRTANNAVQAVISKWNRTVNWEGNWVVYSDFVNDGKPCWRTYTASGGHSYRYFNTALTLNTLQHIAITRSGTTFRGFLNGALELEFTQTYDMARPDPMFLGAPIDGAGANITQYVDELLVLKGRALWTASFNPPAAPF